MPEWNWDTKIIVCTKDNSNSGRKSLEFNRKGATAEEGLVIITWNSGSTIILVQITRILDEWN
jgi:hypothetical protein